MGSGKTVTSPDGDRWRVRRRWLDRPLPDLNRRWRANSKEAAKNSPEALWGLQASDNPAVGLAVVAGLALIVLIVLPLLGVALELVALLLVLLAGLLGRLLLGRPWIVEAENLDDRARSLAFAVKGWSRSRDALAELGTTLATSGPPADLPGAEPIYPPARRLP
jgi:hypothetical protein